MIPKLLMIKYGYLNGYRGNPISPYLTAKVRREHDEAEEE
jgi:hypothetical protein